MPDPIDRLELIEILEHQEKDLDSIGAEERANGIRDAIMDAYDMTTCSENNIPENTDQEEIKPCPICGSKAKLIKLKTGVPEWYISCKRTTCIEQKHLYRSRKSAIFAWNRRVVC